MTSAPETRPWLYGNSYGVLEINGQPATIAEFIAAGGALLSQIHHGHYWSCCGHGHPKSPA